MRKWVGVVVLAAFPVLVAAADEKKVPPGWMEVAGGFKKQAFVVLMPSDGKIEENMTSVVAPKYGQVRIYRTYCRRKDGSVFLASQVQLPPQLTKAPPKVRQDFFRDMFLDDVGGKLVEEKPAMLGTMAGREYLAKTQSGMARYRLYGTGVQMFRLIAVGTKEQVESKDTEMFFESLKRTPPPAAPEKIDK
jgi:hypothetical protein